MCPLHFVGFGGAQDVGSLCKVSLEEEGYSSCKGSDKTVFRGGGVQEL